MYFLKIKFIFRNEAFPVFHYQQFKKKKNPQPQIISLFLSLLIPAEVIYIFFFLKANIKHIQDQTVRWNLNAELWLYIFYI